MILSDYSPNDFPDSPSVFHANTWSGHKATDLRKPPGTTQSANPLGKHLRLQERLPFGILARK